MLLLFNYICVEYCSKYKNLGKLFMSIPPYSFVFIMKKLIVTVYLSSTDALK